MLAGACSAGSDPVAAEIACQQRMVEASRPAVPTASGHTAVAGVYDEISRRYAALPLEGCTDDQRGRAKQLVAVTHALAATAARLRDSTSDQAGSLTASQEHMEFETQLEGFEKRRIVMQQDLDRMRAVRLR